MLSRYLQREAIFIGRSFLYEEEDCKSIIYSQEIESNGRGEEEEKLYEEFEAQASVFCKSVEALKLYEGETSL